MNYSPISQEKTD